MTSQGFGNTHRQQNRRRSHFSRRTGRPCTNGDLCQIQGHNLPLLINTGQRELLQQAMDNIQHNGGNFDLEIEIQPPQQGIRHWYRIIGYAHTEGTQCVRVEGTLQNITPGKNRERALQQEQQRLASIIDGTRIGTWEWNVQTGSLDMNAIAWELLGYQPNELVPSTSRAGNA